MTTKAKWGDDVKVGEVENEVFLAALVNAEIVTEGSKLPGDEGAVLKLARKLRDHYVAQAAEKLGVTPAKILSEDRTPAIEEALGECDQCGGVSTFDLPMCPYCGDADTSGAPAPAAKKDEKTKKPAAVPAAIEKAPADAASRWHDPKLEANTIEKVDPASEKKLDKAVAHIQELKTNFHECHWKLGQAIRDIHAKELWKFRTKEARVAYADFDAFCRAELGFSRATAYRFMDVAAEFTAKQVSEIGPTKLTHLLGLEEGKKKELIARAEGGASEREIAKEAKEARGATPRETGRSSPKLAASAASPEKRQKLSSAAKDRANTNAAKKGAAVMKSEGRVTIAQIEGKKTIKLYAKPATGKRGVSDLANLRRARKVNDMPFGFFDLANGVRQWVEVRANAAGELELVIETRRHEEA